jgi:IclR family KDG regulon transcriptional repressor
MEALNAETGETVHLGTLEDGDVVYIEKVEARHRVRMHSSIGGIAPLHCTGVAKAILAFLPVAEQDRLLDSRPLPRFTEHTLTTVEELKDDLAKTRERGYAVNNEEQEIGLIGVAAPIFGVEAPVVGSISLVAPTSRMGRDTLEGLAPSVLEASRGVSAELGGRSR